MNSAYVIFNRGFNLQKIISQRLPRIPGRELVFFGKADAVVVMRITKSL